MQNKKITMVIMAILAVFVFIFAYISIYQKQGGISKVPVADKASVSEKKTDTKSTPLGVSVIPENTASQEQCFQILKDNMSEAGIFSKPLAELEKMTYLDLSSKLSRNYKNLSSFGVDINQADFGMRLYSFGRQTGYINPPITPFPVSTKSELWDEPAKEFIVAEEYVKDGYGSERFLDCVFIHISSFDPTEVTRENYFYDGPMISLLKTAANNSYKALYNENVSFDHASRPFMSWDRLFVYPQSSQNDYFNKYDVADAYPSNNVDSFDSLSFFLQPMIQIQDYDKSGGTVMKFIGMDEKSGEQKELELPKELEPIKYDGGNKIFPMSGYYQAIENQFPDFAKLLSYRGSLKYATYKELMSEKQDPETEKILAALTDYRQLVSYESNKDSNEKDGIVVSDENLDKLLVEVADADKSIGEIRGGGNSITQSAVDAVEKDGNGHMAVMILIIIVSIGLLAVLVFVIKK